MSVMASQITGASIVCSEMLPFDDVITMNNYTNILRIFVKEEDAGV